MIAIIIPACNEAEALGPMLDELLPTLGNQRFIVAVGANGCTDQTVATARSHGVLVGETLRRGYGHGCQAAIDAARAAHPALSGFLFLAADGANDPADIPRLVRAAESGADLVLGQRTRLSENRAVMGWSHLRANRLLGFSCGLLTGRFFADLGPHRFISTALFDALQMQEWTYGWTIEAQILAVRLGARIDEVDVRERPRLAGEQKVSGVNWRRTLQVGLQILAAGWRCRLRNLACQPKCQIAEISIPAAPRQIT